MAKGGNPVTETVDDLKTFADDSVKFIRKCTKPDKKGIH